MKSIPRVFREQLRHLMDKPFRGKRLTQEFLSEVLSHQRLDEADKDCTFEVSTTTVNRWIKGDNVPDLRDLEAMKRAFGTDVFETLVRVSDEPDTHHGVTWRSNTPPLLSDEQRNRASLGIAVFRKLFVENAGLEDCLVLLGVSNSSNVKEQIEYLYTSFEFALQCGALTITHVARNHDLERALIDMYRPLSRPGRTQLRQVFVADVPDCDGTPIRAEIVAFLAAQEIFSATNVSAGTIGIGNGYTVARTLYYTHLYGLYSKATWIPLICFDPQFDIRFSANAIAAWLTLSHPGSRALQQLFPDEIHLSLHGQPTFSPSHIIVTANGFEPDGRSSGLHPERNNKYVDGHSTEWKYSPEWQYKQLQKSRQHEQVAGEFMGLLLDDEGMPMLNDYDLQQAQTFSRQMDHRHEMYNLFSRNVWLIAAMRFKARAVRMAIRNGLVGNVVVDRSIAEWLLENPAPL